MHGRINNGINSQIFFILLIDILVYSGYFPSSDCNLYLLPQLCRFSQWAQLVADNTLAIALQSIIIFLKAYLILKVNLLRTHEKN
ncbi:hypothetical protein PNOK_0002900 [Pyrrhoderma noxium]|uniref:Uncharacterized protein n=1 Tax=Pyrrhoderma noxium TaxID=2282107 RepID=A0A286UTX7_9AGAM|nr:hypothetical protein PNOK_0002900 [Pyrrhoderma noxium]